MGFIGDEHPRRRLTADEVMGMVEAGILAEDEPLELLRGELVVVSPQGPAHRTLTVIVREMLAGVYAGRAHVQDHSPIRADDHSLPEPDVAVVRGPVEAFWSAHPRGPDTILVVEIAHTSRALDRDKAALYAEAGVPVYWLVDIPRRTVTAYEQPTADGYRTIRTLSETERLRVPETDLSWPVRDLLPPA